MTCPRCQQKDPAQAHFWARPCQAPGRAGRAAPSVRHVCGLESLAAIVSTALLFFVAAVANGQSARDTTYTEVFYRNGSLRIQAYLYRPEGDGPFPIVIYNHARVMGRSEYRSHTDISDRCC